MNPVGLLTLKRGLGGTVVAKVSSSLKNDILIFLILGEELKESN
jgi:hypothetical protein